MKVILKEKISRLGDLGDRVDVNRGFARNFLIPQDKALFATEDNVKLFESKRAELEKVAAENLKQAQDLSQKLSSLTVKVLAKSGESGKLFGSIGPREICAAINELDVSVERQHIRMPEGPLRLIGAYKIGVHLHSDVNVEVDIWVVDEENPDQVPSAQSMSDQPPKEETSAMTWLESVEDEEAEGEGAEASDDTVAEASAEEAPTTEVEQADEASETVESEDVPVENKESDEE